MIWTFEAFLDEEERIPTPKEVKDALGARPEFWSAQSTIRFCVEEPGVVAAVASGAQLVMRAFPDVRIEEVNVRQSERRSL